MIKKVVSVCLISIFMLLAFSCTTGNKWNDIEFYDIDKVEQLSEKPIIDKNNEFVLLDDTTEDRTMDVRVDMQFVKSGNVENEKVVKLINDLLVELVLKQSSEMSVDEAIEQYIAEKKKEFHDDELAPTLYDHLKGRAEYGKDDVINYRVIEDFYEGGAHPTQQVTIYRFDASTGEFLSLESFFPDSSRNALKQKLTERLMQYCNVKTLEELQSIGYLEMMDMFISPNFAMREDSIEFYYNQYDIAPYAAGPSIICLGYDEVKELMYKSKE